MRSLLLIGSLFFSVEGRDRLADRAFFGKDPNLSFVPAYPLEKDGGAVYNWEIRTKNFKIVPKTKFHVSWNPLKCDNEDVHHEVWLSFLKDWIPEGDLKEEEIKRNAISFIFKARSQKPSTNSTRPHFYHVKSYSMGAPVGVDLDWPMNMQNAGFYVELIEGYARISVYFQGMYKNPAYMKATDIPENTRYMTIFGNQQFVCPVFISAVDEDFPMWLPGMPITKYVQGRKRVVPEPPYLINSTLFSLLICSMVGCLGLLGYFKHYYLNTRFKEPKEKEEDLDDDLETEREPSSNQVDSEEKTNSLISARSPSSVVEHWGMDVSFPKPDLESPNSSNVEGSTQDESVKQIDLPTETVDTTKTKTRTSDEHTKITKSMTPEDVPNWS